MKKIIKKAISILLVAVMVFGAAPLAGFVGLELPELNLFSTKAEAATYSGTCGENLSWSLNTSTGVLNITGSGAMTDFSYSSPWYSYHSYIKAVNIPNGVTTIGNWAFFLCENLTNITIPNSVKAIGEEAFGSCYSLKTITIPNSVTSLGIGAFDTCYNLSSVTIPNSVITIGGNAFYDCNSLTSVTIPNSVTTIGTGAFYSCDSLTNITIPNSVTTIGGYAFASCTNLKNVTIGNGVTTIGECAFTRCNKLASITIGNSVTTIGAGAFDSCTSLTNVKLPDSVTTIAAGMFYSCTSLTSITMGKKVTAIGDSAFRYCSSLKSITIPNSVTDIGWSTFGDCTAFTDVYYNGTEAQWKMITIDEGNEPLLNATIHYEKIKLISSNPANGEKYFSLEKDIVLTFNQDIKEIYPPSICIREYETDKVVFTASAECIGINDNTLYLKNLVKSPVVDKNGKTIEGVKLKGNMKYYLDIASDAICFNGAYFEGTKSKDDLAFSTYISKDRSLKEYGFKQEYTEGSKAKESESNDTAEYIFFYINKEYTGKALDDLCIPGLKEGMVPQGLTYYPEKQWYLISAYHKSDLPSEEKNNSVIYALNEEGEFVAQFNIHNQYGEKSTIHAGGIAVGECNLYLTFGGRKIAYLPLFELDVPEGTVKDICIRDHIWLGKLSENTNTSYLNYSEGFLWTGNFYCTQLEADISGMKNAKNPASDKANSIMLGYKLSGTDSLSEWTSFTKIIKSKDGNAGATYTLYLPDKYYGVQGATVYDGVLYLSRALWRPSSFSAETSIFAHEINLGNNSEIVIPKNNWVFFYNLPGGENIFIKNDKLYCVYESSALGEQSSIAWNPKVETDVIWEIDIQKILKNTRLGTVNCPVDVEIYDEETGELVGRIKDNVVDSVIADKDNSIPMEVDGDTKYYWLPANKKYKVVLIGNDIGTMDYSVSLFDENAQLEERVNFFDVELTDGTTYTNEVKENISLSQSVLEIEDGTEIKPNQYFDNMQNAKAQISVSAGIGGTVTESFSALYGDKVTVEADSKDGYIFYAWIENDKIVSTDAEYSFVVKNNRTLKAGFIAFSIRTPSTTTISCGDSIVLHTDLSEALPDGWYIEWTVSNNNFSYSVSDDGTACTITPSKSGDTTFTVTVYDANGNEIVKDEQTMTSKAGFFDKIIAFFKKLFGLTKVIPQAFKGIY